MAVAPLHVKKKKETKRKTREMSQALRIYVRARKGKRGNSRQSHWGYVPFGTWTRRRSRRDPDPHRLDGATQRRGGGGGGPGGREDAAACCLQRLLPASRRGAGVRRAVTLRSEDVRPSIAQTLNW